MPYNGHMYETFGISKHFPVKLQLLLIRAEMLDNPLTARCFIYDVVGRYFLKIAFSCPFILSGILAALISYSI